MLVDEVNTDRIVQECIICAQLLQCLEVSNVCWMLPFLFLRGELFLLSELVLELPKHDF